MSEYCYFSSSNLKFENQVNQSIPDTQNDKLLNAKKLILDFVKTEEQLLTEKILKEARTSLSELSGTMSQTASLLLEIARKEELVSSDSMEPLVREFTELLKTYHRYSSRFLESSLTLYTKKAQQYHD